MTNPTALVIGGSSGLGLELALKLTDAYEVFATGRKDPQRSEINFLKLALDDGQFILNLDDILLLESRLWNIDLLVYAAGFYQEGRIDELSTPEITAMNNVGLMAPIFIIHRIFQRQDSLPAFIAITSTSQWTPRLLEPVYTAVKAGLGMFANSLSLDSRVGKVLVAGPAGMATNFWKNNPRDMSTMLNPQWVALKILELYEDEFKYRFARIMREPPRVEIVETR